MTSLVWAQPSVLLPGYTLTTISSNVPSSGIAQLAFNPKDNTHLYVTRVGSSLVTRYDYDPITAELSNALDVANLAGTTPFGLGFHNNDLYVSLSYGRGDGRITRLSNPDVNGIYQTRHDFIHSIPTGEHDVNQIQIVDDTLYIGIGASGRKGDPAQENLYTMTIARIGALTHIDFSGPIDSDFKGPINYLANEHDWVIPSRSDGLLRHYASGFRNPFGIATDVDGDLWLSSSGNSDPGFLTPDLLYKKVPQGGQGIFPPALFGFGKPHIKGKPIQPFVDLGQSPSPTGFDFVPSGPDAGKVILGRYGSSLDSKVGRDVILIHPETGDIETLITGLKGPTDVVQDPFGRLLTADINDGSVWLLCYGKESL